MTGVDQSRATMRAGLLAAPREARLESVPVPEPGPGEVRIQLEGCGVCGSNLPVWEGRPWFAYPLPSGAPGHEGWGVVDAVGPSVDRVAVGDRVAALSTRAFAEYDVAAAAAVVRLPPELAGRDFPGEPLGCAVNAFRRSAIEPGDTVVIIGIGFLGAVITRLASRAGARVIAVSRRPFSLDVAREQGADVLLGLDDHDHVVRQVEHLTGGRGADRVVEAVGLQQPLDLAGRLVRARGRDGSSSPATTRTGRVRWTCSSGTGAASTSSTRTNAIPRRRWTASAARSKRSPEARSTRARSAPIASSWGSSPRRWR